MTSRHSSKPAGPDSASAIHATRRAGARRELAQRIVVRRGGDEFEAWTLNVSRGGIRLILEDPLDPDDAVDVHIGAEAGAEAGKRPGRVVWVQKEQDGVVVGIAFLDVTADVPPGAPQP